MTRKSKALDEAISRLAEKIEYGALMAATDPTELINTVIDCTIENAVLRREYLQLKAEIAELRKQVPKVVRSKEEGEARL